MSKIQIKRYNGGTSTWENQFPITKAQHLVATSDGTTTIFDANDKLKPAYLPNVIFDSLSFYGTLSANTDLRQLGFDAYNAISNTRTVKGLYWVASSNISLSGGQAISVSGPYSAWVSAGLLPSEEGNSTNTGTTIETGDWIVITGLTGDGTQETPFSFTFAVVNNTYELATYYSPGIVTLSSQTLWADLAGNNVVTDAKLKELVDEHFQPQLDKLEDRVRVFYDDTPIGMVTDDLWFDVV
jgi:hypothetical protein